MPKQTRPLGPSEPLTGQETYKISLSPFMVGDIAAMAVNGLILPLHFSFLAAEASRRPARVLGLCRMVKGLGGNWVQVHRTLHNDVVSE